MVRSRERAHVDGGEGEGVHHGILGGVVFEGRVEVVRIVGVREEAGFGGLIR